MPETEHPAAGTSAASASGASAPVRDDELDTMFAPLSAHRSVLLAVSGGSDSTALAVLFARWRSLRARMPDETALSGSAASPVPSAVVATVDHALRAGSADEAKAVSELAGRLGLPHRILVWEGEKPTSDLQAAARNARYALLLEAARQCGAAAIVTAHTRDDQAETFLMRLGRGSGLAGLSAMRPERQIDERVLARPLLGIDRERLRATLRAVGISWSDDPSNENPAFARVRLRGLMPLLAAEGLTAARLSATAARLARAQAVIDDLVDDLVDRAVERHPGGFAAIDLAAFSEAHEEVALRLFSRVISDVGGGWYGPRLERLEAAFRVITAPLPDGATRPPARTLGGTAIVRRGARLWIHREPGRDGLPRLALAPGETATWDGRLGVSLASAAPHPVTVAALGSGGNKLTGIKAGAVVRRDADRPPASALATVPAAWAEGALVAVPALNFYSAPAWAEFIGFGPWPRHAGARGR